MNALLKLFAALLLFILSGCDNASDEPSLDIYQAHQKGLEILKKSIETHGDIESPSLKMSVHSIAMKGVHRGQSLVPEPPYENYVLENKFIINRPENLEFAQNHNRFAGFDFYSEYVGDGEKGRFYDITTKTYFNAKDAGFNSFRYFPHAHLNKALSRSSSLLYQGIKNFEGHQYYEVSFIDAVNIEKLWIDTETHLLARVEHTRNYPPYGDGISRIDFGNYAESAGLWLAKKVRSGGYYGAWGESYNTFNLSLNESADPQSVDQGKYVDYVIGDYAYRANSILKKLESNLFVIENVGNSTGQWSYNILLAEFRDHIIVFEAPLSTEVSQKVVRLVKESFPDKPIRYLVQSHHHNDHWAGIRDYISRGINIVASSDNEALLERIAEAPFELALDRQWNAPQALKLNKVDKLLKLGDELNEVEIYDIGPTHHANHMLIAYFPKQKLLWQADMLNYGEWNPKAPLVTQLVEKIEALRLDVNTIIGLHGLPVSGEVLNKILQQF